MQEMSRAEWEVMRVVWTKGAATSGDIIAVLAQKRDWADSTIKTLLRRLVAKKALATTKAGRQFTYTPRIGEQATMQQEAGDFFARLCDMKKGAVLTTLVQDTTLSQADIAKLQALLATKAKTAPTQVACNCLGDTCTCEMKEATSNGTD
ncbi:CopY/TcrY family copper transport repressor [Lacticaseibacillus parakribbianus]|uniref:CopY/TcrY family copper transport repressor n=1 Tax=Lacticaseibacillus parakribbianus TaxID=2970927 RepID=UPI0021CAEFC4|nr:CopY/TcrY family copper transport repressor [Lacticaseibacillus parakribbianus]